MKGIITEFVTVEIAPTEHRGKKVLVKLINYDLESLLIRAIEDFGESEVLKKMQDLHAQNSNHYPNTTHH